MEGSEQDRGGQNSESRAARRVALPCAPSVPIAGEIAAGCGHVFDGGHGALSCVCMARQPSRGAPLAAIRLNA